jgi:hypothetical protein
VLHRIAESPSVMVVFNICLSLLLRFVWMKHRIARVYSRYIAKFLPAKTDTTLELVLKADEVFPPRPSSFGFPKTAFKGNFVCDMPCPIGFFGLARQTKVRISTANNPKLKRINMRIFLLLQTFEHGTA